MSGIRIDSNPVLSELIKSLKCNDQYKDLSPKGFYLESFLSAKSHIKIYMRLSNSMLRCNQPFLLTFAKTCYQIHTWQKSHIKIHEAVKLHAKM